jgi:predicted transport protein
MSDIKLFSTKGGVKEVTATKMSLEKELQTLIENNMEIFFGVRFIQSEYAITNGRMDSIGIDENNCPVIFEYKRSVNENVINQGLFYLDWLLDHKGDYTVLVQSVLGNVIADKIDWSMPCVICIASDFTKFDEHAVNQMQRNIKLIRYKNYENDCIMFEQVNAPQVAASAPDYGTAQKKNAVSKDSFKYNYEKAPDEMKSLYQSVRDYVLSLGDDISVNELKLYVALKKLKNVVCIEVYNKWLLLHLRLNPDTVGLQDGFVEDVRNKGHWGTGDLRIIIKNTSDFENAKSIIDRAYNEN